MLKSVSIRKKSQEHSQKTMSSLASHNAEVESAMKSFIPIPDPDPYADDRARTSGKQGALDSAGRMLVVDFHYDYDTQSVQYHFPWKYASQ